MVSFEDMELLSSLEFKLNCSTLNWILSKILENSNLEPLADWRSIISFLSLAWPSLISLPWTNQPFVNLEVLLSFLSNHSRRHAIFWKIILWMGLSKTIAYPYGTGFWNRLVNANGIFVNLKMESAPGTSFGSHISAPFISPWFVLICTILLSLQKFKVFNPFERFDLIV